MDILEQLEKQHQRTGDLLERIAILASNDGATFEKLEELLSAIDALNAETQAILNELRTA